MPESAASEGAACETIAGRLDAGVLFLCDHASNRIPPDLGSLGMSPEDLDRHIAYDIGAAHVTRGLAAAFGAPAVLTRFSRLVIDANRGADDPTLVMQISDGRIVPGNARLSSAEVSRRLRLYWAPYRAEVARLLDAMQASGRIPALVSIHSFTPSWKGRARPWEIGILWDGDPRLAAPLLGALGRCGVQVGDNEPYDGALAGDTLDCHANGRGLASVLIEIRQDLVGDPAAIGLWTERLADGLRPVLDAPNVHMIRKYPTRNPSPRGPFPP